MEGMGLVLSLALLAAAQQGQAAPVTLKLGDPAPPLTVVKWLKGTPQTDLKDGKVRVVEFWATWCGPCIVGMPHLSNLAKAYGDKVAFVGVDASERADDVAKPEAFVKAAGDMMAYNVAYATPKSVMTQDWMKAAGRNGIPCAFVVDKAGKIGWIGHPLMGLEEAVDLALENKLDVGAAAKIDKDWEARMAKGQEIYKALQEAQKAGNVDEALRLNEGVMENLPYMVPSYAATKYALLAKKGGDAAHKYGESILTTHGNAPLVLQGVASTIAATDGGDYALAKALLEKSMTCSQTNAGTAQTMAKVSFKLGDKDGAVKWQTKAVELIGDEAAMAKRREMAVKLLEEYKGGR